LLDISAVLEKADYNQKQRKMTLKFLAATLSHCRLK